MDIMLFTNIYKTSPAGKLINNTVMNMGIIIIILACMGSPVAGVIFCCSKKDAPIIRVNMGTPCGACIIGIVKLNSKSLSGADKSVIHATNGAWRSSMAW